MTAITKVIAAVMATLETNSRCTCQTAQLMKPSDGLQSPIAELLGAFVVPSPAECTLVRETILRFAVDISKLDNEIGRVEKILEGLRHNRAALQKLSDRHQSILHPTRRLPVEILGEIFTQVQGTLGSRSIAPTRVCRHWRAVAIATSQLWNHLKIEHHSRKAVVNAEMVPIWLERSGGQPLNIVIEPTHDIFNPTFEETETENHVVDAILHNHAHRWKDVKLVVTKPMVSFLKNIPENLPILHTLFIDGPISNLGIASLNNFKHASSLRVLTLDKRVSRLSPQFMPNIPWAQLTKCTLLKGGNYTCQDGYRILSKAVHLQSFIMEIDATSTISPSTPSTGIRPADLLSLDLYVVRGAKTQDLLNLLTLPALTELKVVGLQTAAATNPECVAALIARSECQLHRLSLGTQGFLFTHDRLLELFKIVPMLSELELQSNASFGVDYTMMDLLTHQPDHNAGLCCLLPQLKVIKLAVHSTFSYEKFAAFLSSRRDVVACSERGMGVAQLQEAALVTWSDFTASGRRAYHLPYETYDKFMELSIDGLDLYVHDEARPKCALEEYFFPGHSADDSNSGSEEDEWNEDLYDSDLYY